MRPLGKLRPGDVVQIRPRFDFLGRSVGLMRCTIVDAIYHPTVIDLWLVDQFGWPVMATSTDVVFIRRGVVA